MRYKIFCANINNPVCYVAALVALVVIVFSTGCQETKPGNNAGSPHTIALLPSITPGSVKTPEVFGTLVPVISTPPEKTTVTPEPTNVIVGPTATLTVIEGKWLRYENSTYGFSFIYPPGWMPVELPNRVSITYQGSAIALRIWVKQPAEDVTIVRTGVPAGDLVERGMVTFLGQALIKNVLVYQGKDKAVLYNNAGEIRVGDLIFAISLESNHSDYESIAIPENIQEQADKILESFALTR